MATSNVVVSRTGTGWTVDVTACNLLSDTGIKDFIVLHNAIVVSNVTYAKTTATTLTYTGAALPSNTPVEIRRKTPNSIIQLVTYGQKLSSNLWNSEIDRNIRWREEVDLNGAGLVASTPTPQNDAYGLVWAGDTFYPPTRKSVYDKIETLATKSGAVLTGATANVSPSTADNTLALATTAYVKANLADYATLVSPILTGDPRAVTTSVTDNDTSIATTAHVRAFANSRLAFNAFRGGQQGVPSLNYITTVCQFTSSAVRSGWGDNFSSNRWLVGQGGTYYVSVTCRFATTGGTPPTYMDVLLFVGLSPTGVENFVIRQQTNYPSFGYTLTWSGVLFFNTNDNVYLTYQAQAIGGGGYAVVIEDARFNAIQLS
ncbi:tail fiber protein [Anabaena phage A-4L]|uniref:Tail fiber protein n=1 Tax=Anabaena phage A-4L TaxID=1357732 RepID=A0A059PY41_9CAUD|nr:tail fiber protein [Anabaena phage A-4L]AGR48551.1 tail fiber protein [Anabaena phage A-4L]